VWELEPAIVTGLFTTIALYASGIRWLRRATGAKRKLRRELALFTAGWVALVIALLSPVHPLGRVLFSIHMTQHELLMVVAAPLLVLGRPALVMLWAFPRNVSRGAVRHLRANGGARVWHVLTNPFVASLLHALALWIWHAPALYAATATSAWMHLWQHASFLGSALLFWHAMLFGPRRAAGSGLAVLYLFLTALHSGALGALLTFTTTVWYAHYATTAGAWGLSALEDQQLGGLIMWVPAGMIYMVAALALFARWLHPTDERGTEQIAGAAEAAPKCAPSPSSLC
jgi:cytochrome c oxidase assembly factor CtaG